MQFDFELPLILDGASGTNLIAAGMPQGCCTEQWVSEHPLAVQKLQQSYVDAGSRIIYAPTFGANRVSLGRFEAADKADELNRKIMKLTREAVGQRALIAGNMSSTGLQIKPFGETDFEELVGVYREQARALYESGADLFVCETLTSLADARAAVLAAGEFGLPIFVTVTVDKNGETLSDSSLLPCLITLQSMGVNAVGLNCSEGTQGMADFIRAVMPYAKVPVIAKPNAGRTVDGVLQNVVSPDEFAEDMREIMQAGARVVGGCCGTTPKHIERIKWMIRENNFPELPETEDVIAACCETSAFFLSDDLVLSEPLSCTPDLADELFDLEDEVCSVALVEINDVQDAEEFGMNAYMARLPIAVRAQSYEAAEKALRLYQGRLLLDTNSPLEQEQLDEPVKKYGAVLF